MCGRFDQSQTARYYASVIGWTDAVYDSESAPAWNVSPGSYRPVMHLQDGERRIDDVFWSYRARWAEGKVPIMVNARMDKLSNRYWKPLLKKGRAIVPAEGWYEWTGSPKAPVLLRPESGELMGLAGIWRPTERGAEVVILTQAAPPAMAFVHDRMPVLVPRENVAAWLAPQVTRESAVRALVESPYDRVFEAIPVSTRLNRVVHDDLACVAPVGPVRRLVTPTLV